MTEGQKAFINSNHVSDYFKEAMRLQLSIKAKERELFMGKPLDEKIQECIEIKEKLIEMYKGFGLPINHPKIVEENKGIDVLIGLIG